MFCYLWYTYTTWYTHVASALLLGEDLREGHVDNYLLWLRSERLPGWCVISSGLGRNLKRRREVYPCYYIEFDWLL